MNRSTRINSIKSKFKIVLVLLAIMYGVQLLNSLLPFALNNYGIRPRTVSGLIGVLVSPILHVGWWHLFSNTLPLLFLLLTLMIFYEKKWVFVVTFIVIVGGGLVWLFGRSVNHVGASGLIYGLAGYLIAKGIFEKKFKSLMISFVILIFYGSLIWGVFPTSYRISWEGHLFGVISGILAAYLTNKLSIEKTNKNHL
ncbi:MAG: rhomboid family intramembrane serine protease [Crocinitomicaceae bacterium]|nr:rhomboid family intramembrane serine protease [Crocinitomicaceae bacterium]